VLFVADMEKQPFLNRDVHPSGVGRSLKSEIPSDGCSIVSMENGEGQQIAVNAGVACNNATLKKGKSCGPSNPPVNGRDDKHSIHGRKAQKRIRRNSDYEKQKKQKQQIVQPEYEKWDMNKNPIILCRDYYGKSYVNVLVRMDQSKAVQFSLKPGTTATFIKRKLFQHLGLPKSKYWLHNIANCRIVDDNYRFTEPYYALKMNVRGVGGGGVKDRMVRFMWRIHNGDVHAERRLLGIAKQHAEEFQQASAQFQVELGDLEKANSRYDTSHVERKSDKPKRKERIKLFAKKQAELFKTQSVPTPQCQTPKVSSEGTETSNPNLSSVDNEPSTEEDKFEEVEFAYEEPVSEARFLLLGEEEKRLGNVPRFAANFINKRIAAPMSNVNLANTLFALWGSDDMSEYVKGKLPNEVADLKLNCIAYYKACQVESKTTALYLGMRKTVSHKKQNQDNLKNEVSLGMNISNLLTLGSSMLKKTLRTVSNVALNFIETKVVPKTEKLKSALIIKYNKVVHQNEEGMYVTETFEKPHQTTIFVIRSNDPEIYEESDSEEQNDLNASDDVLVLQDRSNMSIIQGHPIASAILEEVIKCVPGAWRIIGRLDDHVNKTTTKYKWHKRSMRYGFFQRLMYHISWNMQSQTRCADLYQQNANLMENIEEPIEPDVTHLPHGFSLPAVEYSHIDANVGYPFDSVLTVNKECSQKAPNRWYPLLFPVTNLVTYSPNFANLSAAVVCRLLIPKAQLAQPGIWQTYYFREKWAVQIDFKPDHKVWFETLEPRQKTKVLSRIQSQWKGDKIDIRTKIFAKSEEFIKKKYPRLIYNVDPFWLLELGDFAMQLSKEISQKLFPCEPTHTISNKMCFFYCSSFSAKEMNQFYNAAKQSNCGYYSLNLGDDTLVVDAFKQDNDFEVDFSNFDSTQRWDGALDFFPMLLEDWGFSKQVDKYYKMFETPIEWKHQSTKQDLELPEIPRSQMSGQPFTSVANTCCAIYATMAHVQYGASYESLGLVAKQKFSKYGCFLQGVFLWSKSNAKFAWTRLPRFLLKLKVFTEPATMYSSLEVGEAEQQALFSQWLGYGIGLENNWFYLRLGKLVRKLTPLATKERAKTKLYYQVSSDELCWIEDEQFDEFMMSRYSISRLDMEEFVQFLEGNIKAIPVMYLHSLPLVIQKVDC